MIANVAGNLGSIKVFQFDRVITSLLISFEVMFEEVQSGLLLDVVGTIRTDPICDRSGSNCKTVTGGASSILFEIFDSAVRHDFTNVRPDG